MLFQVYPFLWLCHPGKHSHGLRWAGRLLEETPESEITHALAKLFDDELICLRMGWS